MALNRRGFLKSVIAAGAAPYFVPASALGADNRPAPSNRLTMGAIGMGGRGTGDMRTFLGNAEVQILSVCDVRRDHAEAAKGHVDAQYKNKDCVICNDFREITSRPDIDLVMIGTPDHWHAIISIEAMRAGKDVFCEKPETLTIREGRQMVDVARRYGRVFSGGSQRVWEDYNYLHKVIRSGIAGKPKEAWISVGGPSQYGFAPEEPIPPGLDWDLWLGPAPFVPFNKGRLNFRGWRDYSGGGMTDWGAHCFGGALFATGLHTTGPVEIIPPKSKEELLTYKFENGMIFHHGGGWNGGRICMKLEGGEYSESGPHVEGVKGKRGGRADAPNVFIPNYKGKGGLIGDFLHCVRTRERPFRDIEIAHRAVTVCHLGNIAYWLDRPIKWDPVKEEIIGDPEASRWLDRPKRAPWRI